LTGDNNEIGIPYAEELSVAFPTNLLSSAEGRMRKMHKFRHFTHQFPYPSSISAVSIIRDTSDPFAPALMDTALQTVHECAQHIQASTALHCVWIAPSSWREGRSSIPICLPRFRGKATPHHLTRIVSCRQLYLGSYSQAVQSWRVYDEAAVWGNLSRCIEYIMFGRNVVWQEPIPDSSTIWRS